MGLTAAAASTIPLYGLYYAGYNLGRDHGQDYETLYLESLIPYQRLQDVTVSLDDGSNKESR